jgi:hypothetical protein
MHVSGLVLGAALLSVSGCGLDVMVMPNPTSPQEGQNVDFTVMVKNLTECEVTKAFVEVATFLPLDIIDGNLCELIAQGIPGDPRVISELLPPELAERLLARAQDRFFGSGGGQGATSCMSSGPGTIPVSGSAQGPPPAIFIDFTCEVGTIPPLGKVTANFSTPAPASGPFRTIAIAIGLVDQGPGQECPPAFPGFDEVAGCFDSAFAEVETAPLMSIGGLIATLVAMLGVGGYGVLRRRR